MKPIDRYRLAYERKEPDRVPFWFEMLRGAQQAGMPWKDFMEDPKLIASASIKATQKFGMDLVHVSAVEHYIGPGWGVKLKWREDPRFLPDVAEWKIKEPEDYEKLEVLDPKKDGMMPQVFKAVELISKEVGGEYPIQLFCYHPMCVLYAQVANPERMEDLVMAPDAVHKALRTITDTHKECIKAFADAGGTHWQLLVTHAYPAILTLKQVKKFSLPYDSEILKEAKKRGLSTLMNTNTNLDSYYDLIVNPNKNYLDALKANFKKVGASLSEIDWRSSLRHWKEKYGKDFCLIVGPGAIAESLLYTPEQLEEFAREVIEIMAPGGGCILGVLTVCSPDMPDENIFALRRAIDKYGVYPLKDG